MTREGLRESRATAHSDGTRPVGGCRRPQPQLYPLSATATLAKSLRTNRVLQVGLKPVAVTVTE